MFKPGNLFSKIETQADALRIIRRTANAFLVVVALQAAVFIAPQQMRDRVLSNYGYFLLVFIIAVAAFSLRQFKSRTAAIVLLLLAGTTAVATVVNRDGSNVRNGAKILVAGVVLWAAVRGVQATFALKEISTRTEPGLRASP